MSRIKIILYYIAQKIMNSKMLAIGFLFSTTVCLSQSYVDTTTNIFIDESLTKGFSTTSLKNKVIIIDFWATWCAPCIAGMPHFNALAKHFNNNPKIAFATITNEEKNKVQTFFNRTKKIFAGYTLLDYHSTTTNKYKVQSIPQSFVINQSGEIKWKGNPSDLTTLIIDSILINPFYTFQEETAQIPASPKYLPHSKNSKMKIILSESADTSSKQNASSNLFTKKGDFIKVEYLRWYLLDFLEILFKKNKESRFVIQGNSKKDFKIDITFNVGGTIDSSFANKYLPSVPNINFLIDLLCKNFNFSLQQKIILKNGYQLVCIDSISLKNAETMHLSPKGIEHASVSDIVNGEIVFANQTLGYAINCLEKNLNTLIDKGVLANKKYDFILDVTSIANANKKLKEYGLSLIEVKEHPFEMLFLDFK